MPGITPRLSKKESIVAIIAESADVSPDARIGEDAKIWHLAQVREGAQIGDRCIVGRGAYIGMGVHLGDDCKIQNYALIYEPAMLADGVFVGPAAVLTNDTYPRAIAPDGSIKTASDWEPVGVTIERGASIGARAVCIAPVTIGAWATVAAGAVVTKDVPAFALVAGSPRDGSDGSVEPVCRWCRPATEHGCARRPALLLRVERRTPRGR